MSVPGALVVTARAAELTVRITGWLAGLVVAVADIGLGIAEGL